MDANLGKLVAASAGAALCLIALMAWQLPTSGSPPGLDLRLIAIPPGELTVGPTGVVAAGRAIQVGDPPVHGDLEIENIAGQSLFVRLAALPSDRDLAGKVRLRAVAAGRTIASGALAALADPRGPGLRLPARGSARVEVSAWIAPGTSGYRGRILDVALDLRADPVGGRG